MGDEPGRNNGLTRRGLFGDAARLGGGVLAGGLLGGLIESAPALAVPGPPPPNVPNPPLTNADYWAFADWIQPVFDATWDPSASSYNSDPRVNAGMLVTHSIAAWAGHQGACRQDARAQALALRLCQSGPYRPRKPGQGPGSTSPRDSSQTHQPGFTSEMDNANASQHISIDPKICEGLYFAWMARNQLNLPASTVSLIVDRITKVAKSKFNLYPNIRLNQINWTAELYEYYYRVTGDASLLKNDYRQQMERFLKGSLKTVSPWKIPNLSQSYSFHRDPFQALTTPQNVESNEYAMIMLDFIKRYDIALQAGMKPLSGKSLETLKAFATRALSAYWAHSGYMNWDTGLYLQRWHLGRYWGWSIQGLSAIVEASRITSADERKWAKYIFDRSFAYYARLAAQRGPDQQIPVSPLFDIPTTFSLAPYDFAVRFQWHAATAVYRNFANLPAAQPPPLYAFDPPIGRLAITTPTYNTAIVGVNNRSFPYGGVEIARLFDSEQRVVANVGGVPPAGFGVMVLDSKGGRVVASQTPKSKPQPDDPPIRLTKSPRGAIHTGVKYPKRPYAGSFEEIQSSGAVKRDGVTVRSRYTFRSASIDIDWTVKRDRKRKLSAEALFPTWGGAATSVIAVLKNGTSQILASGAQVELSQVNYFYCVSQQTGYVVVPSDAASNAVAFLKQINYQKSNPLPGSSLAVRIAALGSWSSAKFSVKIAPAVSAAQAAQVAAALRA